MENLKDSLNKIFPSGFDFINTGFETGESNMKYDMDRTHSVSNGTASPMFRVYAWNPWTVSLGANQKLSDIDIQKCKELGYGYVYRPTGGRAVLHADELTYSVVTKVPKGETVHSLYKEIHLILLESFRSLACEGLEFHKSQPDFRDLYQNNDQSVSCFASTARYEISYRGRKVVGSAQRLFGDTLLQHGSIPLGFGYEKIARVIANYSEEKIQVLESYLLRSGATINESAGRIISFDEASQAVEQTIGLCYSDTHKLNMM